MSQCNGDTTALEIDPESYYCWLETYTCLQAYTCYIMTQLHWAPEVMLCSGKLSIYFSKWLCDFFLLIAFYKNPQWLFQRSSVNSPHHSLSIYKVLRTGNRKASSRRRKSQRHRSHQTWSQILPFVLAVSNYWLWRWKCIMFCVFSVSL